MINDSCSPIPQVEKKKKQYAYHDVKRDDRASWLEHITVQSINQILHSDDNKILNNLQIFLEDGGVDEDIYGPSVPY